MAASMEPVLFPSISEKSCKIIGLKVKSKSKIARGTLIATYKVLDGENEGDARSGTEKFKANVFGTVEDVLVKVGDVVSAGTPILKFIACGHPTVMKDMCAECGADLRETAGLPGQRMETASASVAMVHSIPELQVSKEEALRLANQDEERLLKNRKLTLVVDLDQTVIHTTMDNVQPNLPGVKHFQLWGSGPQMPWYHTKVRPGCQKFLEKISKYYELHIFTMGARLYAHTIAGFLDPDKRFFSHRILSRDECFDPNSKTANLKSIFPCGDSMVCIIDDRDDVWNFAPNLVQVRPYRYFEGTGDINSPPGLPPNPISSKSEGDPKENKPPECVPKEGKLSEGGSKKGDPSESGPKEDKLAEGSPKKDKPAEGGSKEDKLAEGGPKEEKLAEAGPKKDKPAEGGPKEDKLTEGGPKEDKPAEGGPKKDKPAEGGPKEDKLAEGGPKEDKPSESGPKEDVGEGESKGTKAKQRTDEQCNKSKEDKDKDKEDKISAGSPKDDSPEVQRNNENKEPRDNTDNAIDELEEGEIEKEPSDGKESKETSNKEGEEKGGESGKKQQRTENEKDKPADDKEKEDDSDDYFLYLEDILIRIHAAFFKSYNKPSDKTTELRADLKAIVPRVRHSVLKGTYVVFSGVFPTNMPPEQSRAWKAAVALGAQVSAKIVPWEKNGGGPANATTHLIAAKVGTNKVHTAQRCKKIHIVTADWLWCCWERWERVDERMFLLPGVKSVSQGGSRCSTPPNSDSDASTKRVLNKKRKGTPEGKGKQRLKKARIQADSGIDEASGSSSSGSTQRTSLSSEYNPLYSFSSEDLESMDKEVEDIFKDDSSSDESDTDARSNQESLGSITQMISSSSEESLTGESPRGWSKKRKRRDTDSDKEQGNNSGDSTSSPGVSEDSRSSGEEGMMADAIDDLLTYSKVPSVSERLNLQRQ